MELTAEEILKIMKDFFEGIDIEHSNLLQELTNKEAEQQDLLHELELNNLNAVEITKVAVDLKKVRKERRIVKNEINTINCLKDTFVDKYKNKFIEKDIMQALKNLKQLENKQNNPKYTYQYLTEELEIKDE